MIIQKSYKFYAAHRNEQLPDKCRNLHGHRYGVDCFFEVERDGALSTLFGDFDDKIEPLIKQYYDHSFIVNKNDSLYETMLGHEKRTGENLRMKVLGFPSTVENIAFQLFGEITELGFFLNRLEVRETDTSVIQYTRDDWVSDCRRDLQRQEEESKSG